MTPKYNRDLIENFKNSRRLVLQNTNLKMEKPETAKKKTTHIPPKSQEGYSRKDLYNLFLDKLENLEEYIDNFGTRDLVYFFKETASRNGYKYVVSNIKKDMAIMKRLRENFSNREICAMVEFLYVSNQDYLEKDRLSPNVLASGWINTIYADTSLWVDDKYTPKKLKNREITQKGEWKSKDESGTKIGLKF